MESEEILDLQFSVHWSTCFSIPGSDFLLLTFLSLYLPFLRGLRGSNHDKA